MDPHTNLQAIPSHKLSLYACVGLCEGWMNGLYQQRGKTIDRSLAKPVREQVSGGR